MSDSPGAQLEHVDLGGRWFAGAELLGEMVELDAEFVGEVRVRAVLDPIRALERGAGGQLDGEVCVGDGDGRCLGQEEMVLDESDVTLRDVETQADVGWRFDAFD